MTNMMCFEQIGGLPIGLPANSMQWIGITPYFDESTLKYATHQPSESIKQCRRLSNYLSPEVSRQNFSALLDVYARLQHHPLVAKSRVVSVKTAMSQRNRCSCNERRSNTELHLHARISTSCAPCIEWVSQVGQLATLQADSSRVRPLPKGHEERR